MLSSKWFLEQTTSDEGAFHSLREIIFTGCSDYQRIEIIRTGSYGKCLVLDGKIQSSEADEFIYHEALVHPAIITVKSPERILIAGGGEGATAREVLKHKSVSEVVIVDLDEYAVEMCKKFLPELHNGSYEDNRVKVYFEDARNIIEKSSGFDIIILDLPEPAEGGPAFMLYTKEFYGMIFKCLKENGAMVTHAASTSVNNLKTFTAIANTLKQVFPVVRPYTVSIPSFFSPWGFVLASKKEDPLNLSVDYINKRLIEIAGSLKFYDYETHIGIFSLPKYLRKAIIEEERIITDSSPISFY
jgi:spermidine synthase